MIRRTLATLLLLAAALAARAQVVESLPRTEGARLIQTLIEESRMEELRWPDFSDYRKHLRNFYGPVGYGMVWSKGGRITPQARATIALFEAADAKGIHSVDYDGPRWRERIRAIETQPGEIALARFDLAVTITLMRYISDLHIGRINPRNLRLDLDIEGKKYYLPARVLEVTTSADPAATLSDIEPQYAEYRRLQEALLRYRRAAAETETEKPLAVVKVLAPGQAYPDLPRLAKLLQRVGDLAAEAKVSGTTYAEPLVAAVKKFQARHGLEPDGVISGKTFAALNVPLARRAQQLEWALERWRWMPMRFEGRPLIVNIPEFVVRGFDETGKNDIAMRVVVGKAYNHQTPVFEDSMKYVVFRPYWNVPPGIHRSEMVPKVEKDRGYLARNDYEVVDADGKVVGSQVTDTVLARLRNGTYRIRQRPGPSNALGLVKFMFPNENNVYLHSTPAQTLFSRSRRDFSHGCIRVEDPVALAAWVLRDYPEWTAAKIRDAMNGTESRGVTLKKQIPIMILYTTASVSENGEVMFFEDIYGHDAKLENALAAGYPYPA